MHRHDATTLTERRTFESDAQPSSLKSSRKSSESPRRSVHFDMEIDTTVQSRRDERSDSGGSTPTSPSGRPSRFVEMLDDADVPAVKVSEDSCVPRWRRLGFLALFLAIAMTILNRFHCNIGGTGVLFGVRAAAIAPSAEMVRNGRTALSRREITDTDVCKRWSQQSALINGTLYLYGGRSTTDPHQTSNEWNNDFLTLDLTTDWEISDPSLTGEPRPDGPPPVANGYLWPSRSSFFLYGGEFSDTPVESPAPFSTWEYDIGSSSWIEHADPTTQAGVNAPSNGVPVERAAEGAGFGVARLGRGWYFGGHEDGYTLDTNTKPKFVSRVYLSSLLEYTLPGFTNNEVFSLRDGQTAGDEGVYRNITSGGVDASSFPERADGALVYIPGFTDLGVLIGLAGGTNDTFTLMNLVDVYDIKKSTWYKQTTVGKYPKPRVNPCTVVAAAPDGSSYNIYMWGGQELQPAEDQTQYNDMWILSVPSFTWIKVDQSTQSVPPGRSGHTCNIWDGQIVSVGGYVSAELSCDTGIYTFDASSLQWTTSFKAKSDPDTNPFSQQPNQIGSDANSGLEGSYGYSVPDPVVSAIGGGSSGGATITTPAVSATDGPFKTGEAYTYTVTRPDGTVVTNTAVPGSNYGGDSGPNVGAIVAGTIAGVLAIVAAYFAFCAWLYRKQLNLYKKHVAMSQRTSYNNASAEKHPPMGGLAPTSAGGPGAPPSVASSAAGSGSAGIAAAGAVGQPPERRQLEEDEDQDDDDLLRGLEPSFWGTRGVLLNPRRSLRVINRD